MYGPNHLAIEGGDYPVALGIGKHNIIIMDSGSQKIEFSVIADVA